MSRKLSDSSKPEKSCLSYADLHHEITKTKEEISLEPNSNQTEQEDCRMASEEDELVKYMSKLPVYLEKGVNINEKVLNVGVLDWASLEKWQCGNKHVPDRSSQSLTSTSHTSSSISEDGLSGKSSRGPSWSRHRRISRPLMQSHLVASSVQERPGAVKSFGGGVGNFQSFGGGRHSDGVTNGKYVRAGDHRSQNYPTIIPKVCKRDGLNPCNDRESGILPNVRVYEAASCAKLEINKQNGGLEKSLDNLRKSNIDTVDQHAVRESKPIVVLLPRDNPQDSHYAAPNMQTSSDKKLGTPCLTKFSDKLKEHSHKHLNGGVSHACPLPNDVSSSCSQFKGLGSSPTDSESIKVLASTFSAPFPVKGGVSPCKSRKAEERKQTIGTSANGPPHGMDQKVTTEKSRSSSPFHRLGISLGFTSKSGCKDTSHVPHQSSSVALKSSSEHVRGYARSNTSGNDRPGDAAKGRTSPLRRLLDPLLKPKAVTCSHSMESSQKDSMLINKNSRPGNEKISTLLPERELDRDHRAIGCAPINTADSSKDKKHMASTFQGLLRIAVKNGQPLFTFAVDNNSNILAATVKSLPVSAEDECKCIYTFFTFRENKKKNGIWMNQTGKSKGPDYIHHVVAQMKVSDSHHYYSASQNHVDCSAKEFVLFSVKPRQGDSQVTEYQPNDELAAIVVKSPKAIDFMKYEHQSSCQNDIKNFVGVTVVLPGGVHSLPSNGGPSSLIERWKTGGSCDCGGWDLACKLKIFANEKHTCRKSGTSKAYLSDQIELFLQGNDQNQGHRPAFSFSPFKPGIYSVAFDSSLSHLQAFSVCISLVDGRMPYELCRSRDSLGVKNLREMMLAQTEEIKAFGTPEDTPASYVAYPPLSPVGRV